MQAAVKKKKLSPPVPVLPRAAEIRETVAAVERGLKHLRGLAAAVERVEEAAGMNQPANAAEGEAAVA